MTRTYESLLAEARERENEEVRAAWVAAHPEEARAFASAAEREAERRAQLREQCMTLPLASVRHVWDRTPTGIACRYCGREA